MSREPFKTCACGATYTRREWSRLEWVGEFADDVERLHMRNCAACGSTLAVNVGLSATGRAALAEAACDPEADTEPPPPEAP